MVAFAYFTSKIIVSKHNVSLSTTYLRLCVPFSILSIIIGGRYNVGADWGNYRDYFNDICKYGFDFSLLTESTIEPLYWLLSWCVSLFTSSSSVFFTVVAFLIFSLLYKSTTDRLYILPLVLFFFFTNLFGFSLNVVRQSISIAFFFLALSYYDINKMKMLLYIIVSILFHYSSMLTLLAFILLDKRLKFLDNRMFCIGAYLVTLFFASFLNSYIISLLPLDLFSQKYVENVLDDSTFELSSGLGYFSYKMIDLLLIYTSCNVRDYYSDKKIDLMYRCFFVGVGLSNVMGFSITLARVPYTFVYLKIFLLSYLFIYLQSKKANWSILLRSLIVCFFLVGLILAVYSSSNLCSPYNFKWL